MTKAAVLIAGFSGRALAACARRAGYRPFVADCFADEDTATHAEDLVRVKGGVRTGLKQRALIEALEDLEHRAGQNVKGLLLGTGFESEPRLLRALSQRFDLIGNTPEAVRRCKDPDHFFPLLESLGVTHPETTLSPPENGAGWVKKRVGGSGGVHIQPISRQDRQKRGFYYQRIVPGVPVSLAGIVGNSATVLAFCKQWIAPSSAAPYRFGGLAGPITLDPDTEARMIEIALELAAQLDLVGFVSFDFLLSDEDIFLLEVNPRFTAALDVLDDRNGTMLEAHIAAIEGRDAAAVLSKAERPEGIGAAAYLYCDRDACTVPDIDWPDWATDRPHKGAFLREGQPLAGVIARGASVRLAEEMCRRRLGELEDLLYGPRD